jgi:hypothetical protein
MTPAHRCRLFFSQAAGRSVKFRDFVVPGLGRDGLLRKAGITRSNETMTIRADFVERDETIADHLDFTLNLPVPQPPRTRTWRRN